MRKKITTISAVLVLLISSSLTSCTTSKNVSENSTTTTTENNNESKTNSTDDTQEMKKLINSSSFSCSGESSLEKLTIHGSPANCEAISCSISRFGSGDNAGLKIRYKATLDNETVQVFFHLHGVEDDKIKPGVYNVNTNTSNKYGKIYLESGNPKEIQEITIYKGIIKIEDYGYSSNTICGSIELEDEKGNQVHGKFNEMITGL